MALLGALLGTVGAYLGLATGYFDDIGTLAPVPALHLLVILLGVPMSPPAPPGCWQAGNRRSSHDR